MSNPFEKRATEYLRDDDAFLAIVSPEPVLTFLEPFAKDDRLYDRLVVIRGAPGSGKTTLARLFMFGTISAIIRGKDAITHAAIAHAVAICGAVRDNQPTLIGARLSLDSEYRDLWEFPYSLDLRMGLLATLVQARGVLAWLRALQNEKIAPSAITIVPRADAAAALNAIGGTDGVGLGQRAREVEAAMYKISAALVHPNINEIEESPIASYRPFDVIERIEVRLSLTETLSLRPLLVLDDAQMLHPEQLVGLQRWLARRELRVSRWILSWMDVISPVEALVESRREERSSPELPGISRARDVTEIYLQGGRSRGKDRRDFRKTARDMANRHLQQLNAFTNRGIREFADLLAVAPEPISASSYEELKSKVARTQRKLLITPARREALETEVTRYGNGAVNADLSQDVAMAMLSILMHRLPNRMPQLGLFGQDPEPEPKRNLTADSGVADGARVHLLHTYGRTYYYGIEDLCDASSENAEQFIRLAATLVEAAATQMTRGKIARLSTGRQHQLLRKRADDIYKSWRFPDHEGVRRLCDKMAYACVAKSLEPNAPLKGGANAFGILQDEFDKIPEDFIELAWILHRGVAYNAFTLVQNYPCKNQFWCLIELGGIPSLKYGLTLKRGGFIESTSREVAALSKEAL